MAASEYGVIELSSSLTIENLEFDSTIDSAIIIGSGDLPWYTGDYIVDPRKVSVILQTRNKALSDDVVVKPIYRFDNINPEGGITVTIGLE